MSQDEVQIQNIVQGYDVEEAAAMSGETLEEELAIEQEEKNVPVESEDP